MDITYTNVLQGARQYFQGVPTASNAPPTPPTPPARPSLHYAATNHHPPQQQQQHAAVTTYSSSFDPYRNTPSSDVTPGPTPVSIKPTHTNGNYQPYSYDGAAYNTNTYSTTTSSGGSAAYHELKTPQQQQQQYPVSSASQAPVQYYYTQNSNSRAANSPQSYNTHTPPGTNVVVHQHPQYHHNTVSPSASVAGANNTYAAATSTAVAQAAGSQQQPSQYYQQKQYIIPVAASVPVPNHSSHVSAAYLDKTKAYGGAIRPQHPSPNHVHQLSYQLHVPEEARAHYASTTTTASGPSAHYVYKQNQQQQQQPLTAQRPAQLAPNPPQHHQQHTTATDSRYIDNRQHHTSTTHVYDNRLVSADTRSIPADNRFPNMRQAEQQPTQQPPPKAQTNISLDYRIITAADQPVPDAKQMYEPPTSKIGIVPRQRRESPLDLSVKTVKTTADSTLDDAAAAEESKRICGYDSRYVESPLGGQVQRPQPQQERWNNANIVPNDYTTKSSHYPNIARAPKVDFSPNFNMPNNSDTTGISKKSAPHSNNTQQFNPATNIGYKDYNRVNYTIPPQLQQQQQFQQQSQHPPRTEIQAPPRKRHLCGINSGVPNKMMKPQQTDTWRQTIDHQIDQRINSYARDQNKPNGHVVISNNVPLKPAAVPDYKCQSYHIANPKSIVNTQYGPHNIAMFQTESQKRNYQQYLESKGNVQANNPGNGETPPRNAATKKVLNLLRNSLQVKEQREVKKKLEQQQQQTHQNHQIHHPQEPPKHNPYNLKYANYPLPNPLSIPPVQCHTATTSTPSAPPPTPEKHILPIRAIERPVYNRLAVPLSSAESIKSFRRDEHHNSDSNIIVTNQSAPTSQNNDLDGLAAFLAARIRTKGELKQVSSSHHDQNSTSSNNNYVGCIQNHTYAEVVATQNIVDITNRNNEQNEQTSEPVIVANKISKSNNQDSGMRSSTETSVFDFPDSDNEIETPVLERRQSLLEMRKDRKLSITKQESPPSVPGPERPLSPSDLLFDKTCDSFLEQLKSHVTPKKRGRKKKVTDSPNKDETANVSIRPTAANEDIFVETDDDDIDEDEDEEDEDELDSLPLVAIIKSENRVKLSDTNNTIDSKSETQKSKPDVGSTKKPGGDNKSYDVANKKLVTEINLKEFSKIPVIIVEDINKDKVANKVTTASAVIDCSELSPSKPPISSKYDSSSDSDIPLINCKFKLDSMQRKKRKRLKRPNGVKHSEGSSCSDSELESTKISHSSKNSAAKNAVQLQCNATTPLENKVTKINVEDLISLSFIGKPGKKPLFGDGSQFHSGWEEELLKYKQSLRIPSMLIHVTQPTRCNRLSTSLPDLDPCPLSPANSSIAESRIKPEPNDSDIDSNCSYTFSLSKTNYDSEGSSSIKSLKSNMSILDRLLEKCGGRKRRKYQRRQDDDRGTPKPLHKSDNSLELLPTPGLERTSKKETSVLLGFRKETVENFKEAFIHSSNVNISKQFSTVVLKSRTRTETRVLKEKATIREVFGEDRPASAPPVTCLDALKSSDVNDDSSTAQLNKKDAKFVANVFFNSKQSPIIEIKSKRIIDDKDDKDKDSISTLLSLTCEKKRGKLRSMRRKFSSGFDYIRKKKKQIKKEDSGPPTAGTPVTVKDENVRSENVTPVKQRRGFVSSKATPETAEDIAKEIKMWVLNKGVGETHLHRAARMGLTDVTAYCLEEVKCFPSPKDNAGYTPLHEACARGHLDIARLLLLYGANLSESAQGGIRPLHEAAENGFVEIIRLLLSYGADATLATYSGQTPLSLATDEATIDILQNHMLDLLGKPTVCWTFNGPSVLFDPVNSGYNPLTPTPDATPRRHCRRTSNVLPSDDSSCSDLDLQIEVSEHLLPNLYTLRPDQPTTDRWILLHDLSNVLKIKSRDTLLRQLAPPPPSGKASTNSATTRHQASVTSVSTTATANTAVAVSGAITITQLSDLNIVRDMKMSDFLEHAHCCQFLHANEKLPVRASKVLLVRYTDKVRELLNVERCVITASAVTMMDGHR